MLGSEGRKKMINLILKVQIKKFIRRQLLKIDRVKRAVANYRFRHGEQQHHTRWGLIMRGLAVSDAKTEARPVPEKCEVRVDYLNGWMVSQNHISPLFIDSTNWGGK